MSTTPAEMMKEYVNSRKFSSTDEVMAAMKEMFRDVLQQVMECELSDELGYEKSERRPPIYHEGCVCGFGHKS